MSTPERTLHAVDLEGWCKTSGSKGLQLYVPLNSPEVTHDAAGEFANLDISRNAPCPCGSGNKYKHCHGAVGAAQSV